MTTTFAELGLNEQILAGVEALGFSEPTPVQAQAIPLVLQGRDLVASAQTGTGKTAAFTLPALQLIMAAAAGGGDADKVDDASGIEAPAATVAEAEAVEATAAIADDVAGKAAEPTAAATVAAATKAEVARATAGGEADGTDSVAAPATVTNVAAAVGAAATEVAEVSSAAEVAGEAAAAEAEATVAATPDGTSSPTKRRRRRRRRKRATDTGATEGTASEPTAAEPVATPQPEAPAPAANQAAAAPGTSKRRRRRRRKTSATEPAPQPQAAPSDGPARPLALVVTPTRELAQQIERVTTTVCKHTGQRCVIVMGGAKFDKQLSDLACGCDLLVATPGRLIDLMEHHHVDLGQVRILVLDEADRMLDMGFWPSVRRIVQALPTKRQNLLFSATIPPSIKGTIDAMLTNPASVEIARVGETADTVEEHLCPVTQGQKIALLRALVETGGAEPGTQPERVLVFCRTKHRVDDVSKTLQDAGLKVEVMHSDRPQRARDKALERFRAGSVQLLVATDVMSRGIDVSGIDAVVNYDVPMDPEDYVHRIGRTGRAGATGHAYTFVAPDEITPLREIEYFTKKLIPIWDLSGFAYDSGRIVPNASRATSRAARTMFSGSKPRRGFGGRFGRHT